MTWDVELYLAFWLDLTPDSPSGGGTVNNSARSDWQEHWSNRSFLLRTSAEEEERADEERGYLEIERRAL